MRYAAAAVLSAAVTVLGAGASAQDAKDGKYVSKDGGFSVTFPKGVELKTKNMDLPGGMKMTMISADGGAEKKGLMVMHMAFPPNITAAMPAEKLLEMIAKQSAAKAGGTEVSNKEIAFGKDKYPGREIVLDKDGVTVNLKIVMADPNLYVLTTAGPKSYLDSDEVKAFQKSFEITAPAKSAKKSPATKKAID